MPGEFIPAGPYDPPGSGGSSAESVPARRLLPNTVGEPGQIPAVNEAGTAVEYVDAGDTITLSITDASVTNAKLANMTPKTFKGRHAGTTGPPQDVSAADAAADLVATGLLVAAAQTVNAQTGTSYTLVAGDVSKLVTLSNAAAITLTVPQDSDATIPVGSYVDLVQLGAGQVTVQAGSGATLRVSGLTAKARAQYARLGVQKIAANTWSLFGDLAAS